MEKTKIMNPDEMDSDDYLSLINNNKSESSFNLD